MLTFRDRGFCSQYTHNKGFAEDLTEGKFSFPIVHAVRSDMSNRQVLSTYYFPVSKR